MHANKNPSEEAEGILSQIVGAAYAVSNVLGAGFLEKVYERALVRELALRGLQARSQVAFSIQYKNEIIADYIADLVVEDQILVELKCVDRFAPEHMALCLNYLKASGLHLALLINFKHPKVVWQRVIRS
jgi:GxxExxY protein